MEYETLEYDAAVELIPDTGDVWFQQNSKFANGDHWQDGDGWTGPRLDDNHALSSTADSHTERIFVSEDVIGDIIERHVSGVVGRPPTWMIIDRQATAEEGGSG